MTNVVVTFPLSGDNAFTTRVSISMAEYCHEITSIQLPDLQAGSDFIQGTPVAIQWQDFDGGYAEWYGYIDTVTQSLDRTTAGSMAICVGMTYPLKEKRQDIWTNVTGDGVAEAMASRWRLGADLDPSSRLWPSLAQAGVSDWALLVELAHTIGFTLYSRGPVLAFHERTREMTRVADAAPIFIYSSLDPASDILGFTPLSSTSVNANTRSQITSIDSAGAAMSLGNDDGAGTLLTSLDRLPTFTSVSTMVASDAAEAVHTLEGQTEDSRFSIQASVVLRGDARLRPAMPIYLGGLPPQWNGLWFVLSVEHQLSPQSISSPAPDTYVCFATVGRDGMGVSNTMPASSKVHHTDATPAEIGNTGMWQCGPFTQVPQEEPPPTFVSERLALKT